MKDLLENRRFAATFVDYENVYYHLKNTYADFSELHHFITELLRYLLTYLEEKYEIRTIMTRSYGDFGRIKNSPQDSLFLMGANPTYVLGTEHKNAADMRLCIDAMDALYTRPEIETFVIFAGDRDYIPLIQHLKEKARFVIAVGFLGSFSGDLLTIVGHDQFIDAGKLFTPEQVTKLEEHARRQRDYQKAEAERAAQRALEEERKLQEAKARAAVTETQSDETTEESDASPAASSDSETSSVGKDTPASVDADGRPAASTAEGGIIEEEDDGDFNVIIPDLTEEERRALEITMHWYGHFSEIHLTPALRRLTDEMPSLADYERKNLFYDLEFKGAIRSAKRPGEPFEYTVIILNYNHPVVRELC